jgi:hypothetical protein
VKLNNIKTRSNVRNTKYGEGYTSAEAALMLIASLAGLDEDDLDVLTEDAGLKDINHTTFDLNRKKIDNLLFALSERVISVGEFKESLRGELDRSDAKFDSIEV